MKALILLVVVLAAQPMDHAESLVLQTRYDEALAEMDKFTEDTPRYYYNRMICEYALLKMEDGLKSSEKLLKFDQMPNRYRAMGNIINHDLSHFRRDSLQHVSHLMKDSQRRLQLGEAGRKVQKSQAEVVAMLDYLIEKNENKGKSPSQGHSHPNSGKQDSKQDGKDSPAKDSNVKGKKAPGNVDQKKLVNRGGWGSLPPKEQAKAMQHAKDNYPPHYQKIIQEYAKRMAERQRR